MSVYYNENDPAAAAWIRELISANLIPDGWVDTRSILEVRPHEIESFEQQHFFAGIAGWALALRLAEWPDDKPVRTGSCPCQPFSISGKKKGVKDNRHLWPVFRDLITFGEPTITFGEQVASPDGREWLAGVRNDLEGLGYEVGAADLCASGVGSPHIRQRLYWVANANGARFKRKAGERLSKAWRPAIRPANCGAVGRMAYPDECSNIGSIARVNQPPRTDGIQKDAIGIGNPNSSGRHTGGATVATAGHGNAVEPASNAVRMGHANDQGWQGRNERIFQCEHQWPPGASNLVVLCEDGKARRFEPGSFPLADGFSGRVGLLRGYGNGIVPQLAAEFIKASVEAINARAIHASLEEVNL